MKNPLFVRLSFIAATFFPVLSVSAQVTRELYAQRVSGDTLGTSLAMNAKYIVGGRPDSSSNTGDVAVFDTVSGKLLRNVKAGLADRQSGDRFGTAVALRGEELIVGAPGDTTGVPGGSQGSIYIFNLSTGRLVHKIIAQGDRLAFGAALAVEGEYIVVGAPLTPSGGTNRGEVIVFRHLPGATDFLSVDTFGAPTPENNSEFGSSVAIYGNHVLVGQPKKDEPGFTDAGNAHRFTKAGLIQQTYKDATLVANGLFGTSVALTGSSVIVGEPGSSFGTTRILAYDGSTKGISSRGRSVAAFGRTIVSGHPDSGSIVPGSGSAGIVGALNPSFSSPDDYYLVPNVGLLGFEGTGFSVAIYGDMVAVGVPGRTTIDAAGSVVQGCIMTARSLPLTISDGPVGRPFRSRLRTGSVAPNLADARVRSINYVALGTLTDPEDHLHAVIDVAGSGTGGKTLKMWSIEARDMRLTMLSTIPYNGLPVSTMYDPVSNTPGFFGIMTTLAGTGITSTNNQAFFDGGSLVIRTGTDEPSVGRIKSFGRPRQGRNSTSQTSYAIPITFKTGPTGTITASNNTALRIGRDSPVLLREGQPTSAAPFSTRAQLGSWVSMEDRFAVFAPTILTTGAFPGVPISTHKYLMKYNTLTSTESMVTRNNEEATGVTGGFYSSFLSAMCNGYSAVSGETAFRALLKPATGITSANNEGVWVHSGTNRLKLRKGFPVTGLPASLIVKRILKYWVETGGGNLRALVQFSGSSVTSANDVALINVNYSGNGVILLREGDYAPGCASARIGSILSVDANLSNSYAILATLVISPGVATASDNLVLYATSGLSVDEGKNLILMLRKGGKFKTDSTASGTVSSIAFSKNFADATGVCGSGLSHAIGSATPSSLSPVSLAMILSYTDKTKAAAVVTAP